MAQENLVISIQADSKNATENMKVLAKAIESLQKTMADVQKTFESVAKAMGASTKQMDAVAKSTDMNRKAQDAAKVSTSALRAETMKSSQSMDNYNKALEETKKTTEQASDSQTFLGKVFKEVTILAGGLTAIKVASHLNGVAGATINTATTFGALKRCHKRFGCIKKQPPRWFIYHR